MLGSWESATFFAGPKKEKKKLSPAEAVETVFGTKCRGSRQLWKKERTVPGNFGELAEEIFVDEKQKCRTCLILCEKEI